jgi:hypothetical protein
MEGNRSVTVKVDAKEVFHNIVSLCLCLFPQNVLNEGLNIIVSHLVIRSIVFGK